MERRVQLKLHARCEVGEKSEIISKTYLSLFFLQSKMKRIAGVQSGDAQKSSDMFMKTQYMDEITRWKRCNFCHRYTIVKQYDRTLHNAKILAVQYISKKSFATL